MSTFKLQVHSRDLAVPVIGNMASHTGYDLVEYDNNGNVLSISSVDLIEENGEIRFDIKEKSPGKTYIIDGKIQAWPNHIHFDDDPNQAVDQEFAEDKHFYTADIPVADPQAMFDKIVFDAKFRNALADSNVAGGGINYQTWGPNCNTWTNYIGTQFIGTNVFNRLPASDGIIYDYTGNNKTFNDCSNANDRENCALLEEYSQRFFNDMSGRDIGDVNVAIGGAEAGGWYCRISDCNIDGTLYTYVYDTDNGNTIEVTNNQNSFVYAEDGQNHVTTGSGNDEIHSGKDYDIINAGTGDDKVYAGDGGGQINLDAGNDYFEGGSGADMVNSGQGNDTIYTYAGNDDVNTQIGGHTTDTNHVYLGAGGDTFTGGVGIDIVDGGVSEDVETDENTINLGANDDEYRGGKGKDIVHGGADDDHIWGGDGNNELYGDSGNDHLYGGQHQDRLYGGTGRDYFSPEKGTNRIDCGTDNNTDVVMINNDADGIDTIYNVSARDIISCAGGFDLESMEQVGSDVIIYGNRNNKIVIKDVKLPEEEEPEIPAENMPILYQPDGSVLQWDGSEYVDSGTKFPPYDEKPEDPEDLPDIPTPEPGEGDNPPLLPVIPEKPEEPEGGTEKPQTDNPPSIPEDTKGNIGKLWEDAENSRSPLVVDLDGDGKIEAVSTDGNVHFDFDSNQKIENSGWIGKNEGFLVRDLNGNGQIDNGTEMFGNHTVLQNGKNAVNGFEALKDLDSNGNGKFDAEDEAWSQVKVWRDANTNGIADSGELLTLEQAGIESINLKYDYQKEADENGNLEIQQGTFNRTDGTMGKVSDIWFDVDGTNTILNEDDITIPDDIKNLPDIKGWGNVYSLHAAMALDETGALKSLVEQYLAATDDNTKDTLLNDIIYHWTGVQDMDPVGRNPSQVYGNVLGDARKLEALEEFMGEDYLGTWCWGERESNPHGQAAPMILQAFELLKNYVGTILSADLANNPYLQKIILTYNAETKHWDVNVDQAVALLQEAFETDATNGKIEMLQLSNILRYYDNAEDIIAAFQAKGAADGTFFETELLNFGHNSVGSAANDNLFGTEGNDLMNGLAGNDIIKAAEGDDTVLGGVGNDYIYGEDGDDILDGEEGNDYLFGGNGNDTLKGGAGDDVLSGGNGADVYLFEKGFGNDSIDNTQDDTAPNADIIKFGEGILPENAILQRQGFDLIISVSYEDGTTDSVRVFSYFDKQGTSSTTVSAIQFADGTSWDYEYVLDHWNSLPDINGGVTLEGNNDNNTINGTSANDILSGNGGNDTIYGNAGNDFIYGGTGNDRLEGGAGNDTYLWHLGDGLDTIYDNANQDTIQFGEGIVWDYLTFRNSGNDLVILVHGQEDQGIIIQNFFSGQDYKIEKINFFDGSSVNLSEIGLTLKQLKTGESIKGTEFDDIIYANGGNDTVNAGIGDDTIYGEAGFDTLYGEDGNDTLIGGTGNDRLEGGLGDDTYIYNVGDGLDTIYDDNRGNTDNDTIKFGEGISFSDITFSRKDNNLIMTLFNDITQGVIIQNFFSSSYYQVEKLEFADGTTVPLTERGFELVQNDGADNVSGTDYDDTIYGKDGNDTIYGGSGNDTLIGGKGNDRLEGSYGDDTYIYNMGDGFDTIDDYNGGNTDNDTIKFGEGISFEDLLFERDNNSLIIYVNNDRTQGIKIQDYYSNVSYYKVEKLEFADGTIVETSTIAVTTDKSDALAAQNFTGTDNNDTLTGGNFGDTLTGNDGDDVIDGGAGNDTIYGGSGNDTLIGGKGNDHLEGSYGDDTYIWNLGDGFDTIDDYNGGNTDNDTIKFGEGITFEDLSFERDGNDLVIYVNNDRTQGISIQDYYSNVSYYKVEKLEFTDGTVVETSTVAVTTDKSDALAAQNFTGTDNNDTLTGGNFGDTLTGNDGDDVIDGGAGNDTIYGGSGNDTLIGGKGNDRLDGSYGDDTYIWNLGDGFDTIDDYNGGNTDNDTIKFGEGISFEDLLFERDGNSLIIYVNNDRTQGIKIQDHYSSYSQVEKLEFADGTIVETSSVSIVEPEEPSENAGQTISGTNDDDILTGSKGDDTINAEDGYNDITGGKGNDIISAGYDRDTFYYNLGDGYDKITDLGGRDQIIFGDGISKENISFYRKNDNLIISINDDFSQGIEIIDFFRNNDNRIENIKFADNSTLRLTTGLTLKTNELDGSITGTVEDDTLIGNIGENNLNGSSGDDILNGGKGNDTLDGDIGNDTYIWNLGDDIDTIRDTAGLNTIKFGENISFDDLTFKQDGNNLRLIVKNDISQGIIIQDHFSSNNINNNYHPITIFEFSDGSKFDFRENNITLTYDNRDETIISNIGDNIIDAQGGDDTITTYGGDDIINGGAGDDEISSGNGNDIITAGSGNDIINGEAGNDTYIWNLGDGMDTITDSSGFDKIKFGEGITSANLSFFKQGNNLLIFINDNYQEGIIINRYFEGSYNIELLEFTDGSSINLSQSALDIKLSDTGESIDGTIYNDTITGGDGNDTINGGNGDDTLSGGIGEDTMSGGDGADIISGGTGDDTIDGGAGNDTYIWNLGDGMDTITDSQGTDKIVFGEGISYDDLSFSQTNSDLYINVQNMPNQGLLIKNYFASGNSNRIETLEFSNGNLFDLSKNALILKGDGTVNGTIYDDSITGNNNDDTITAGDGNDIIYGNAGNDNIDGGNGDDIIYGGQGCDTLKGGYGNDTYVWNLGDDLDTIEDDTGQNTLLFGNGISFKDLGFNMVGNNLLIFVNGDKTQGVQINNFLNENDLYKIEYLKFSDGTSIYLPDLGLNMAYRTTDDTINGTYNDDNIVAGGGNDTVNAGDGDDSIYGGKGNDTLNGGNGRDSYYYNLGDGYDTIAETRGNDKIIFGEGISINNLSFRQNGSNLDILINNDVSQGVTVKDFYSGTNYQVETLQFADGSTFNLSTQEITLQQTDADDTVKGTSYNDVIYGNGGHDTINAGEGNDTIVGGIGNDILNGGNGDDTYVYNLGDGFDTITDTGGDDKIVFGEGISQSDLSFEKIGNNLKISVNGKDDKGIQINDHFRYDSSKVETIEFHDGSTLDISNADQLIQAMNSFSISNSASTDTLSNPTQDVSDMYSLAASQDLTRKAI